MVHRVGSQEHPALPCVKFRELLKSRWGSVEKGQLIMIDLHFPSSHGQDRISYIYEAQRRHFGRSVGSLEAHYWELNAPPQFWALKKSSKHKFLPAWLSQHLLTLKNTANDSDCKRRTRVGIANATRVLKIRVVQCATHKAGRNVPEIHL